MSTIRAHHHRFIVTGTLILFSLGFLGFFTESDKLSAEVQSFIVGAVFFLAIPVLYSRIVLKESLKNIGWQRGNVVAGIVTSLLAVAFGLGVVVGLVFLFPSFREQYLLPASVEREFLWFLLYELILVPVIALFYEVFFRGLIELSWLRNFGWPAVIIQAALFIGLVFFSQGFSWMVAPLLLFSPLAGYVAYRTRSIWYSFGASWAFLFLTDVFFLILT